MNRILVLAAAVLLAHVASVPPVAAAELPRLFGASIATNATSSVTVGAVQERIATPNFTLIPDLAAQTTDLAEGPYFTLDLFDNLTLTAQVVRAETTASGGIAIIARLTESDLGSVVLVQNGTALTGSVTLPLGSYSILPQADGTVSIARVAPQLLPPEGEPRVAPGAEPTARDLAQADAPADTGKLIDVIVFWTPAAQTDAGSLVNIQNNIDTAITLTNNAYRNSGIAQRVRLVSKQAVVYTENTSGFGAFDNALTAITNGTIAGTATARNTFGADEVVLIISDPSFCGLAWLPSTISSANSGQGFAVVGGGTCLTTNFSFGHELGHNMGAHHDPYVLNAGPCSDGRERGAFCSSRGLSHIGADPATSWRTIMAYNNECAATVGGCTRLPFFSNPMVKYSDGNPMGDATLRNNTLTLNKSANAVSNYRATAVPIAASFSDVPLGNPVFGYVEFMYQAAFTGGCATGPLRYCPTDYITRGQMAVFLARTKRGALFSRTPTGTIFTDVTVSTPFAGFIEQMWVDGITTGCAAGPAYCPTANVNRAQMAKFLLKAKCGSAYTPATPGVSPFADVPVGDPFLPWINKVYTLGITQGCLTGPLRYCPNDPVTRASMAKFIYSAFPYGDPTDACTP